MDTDEIVEFALTRSFYYAKKKQRNGAIGEVRPSESVPSGPAAPTFVREFRGKKKIKLAERRQSVDFAPDEMITNVPATSITSRHLFVLGRRIHKISQPSASSGRKCQNSAEKKNC